MASPSKDSFCIEKINCNNYAVWKFKVEMILIKEDLHNHITDDQPDRINTDWTKEGNKARAIINLSLEDSQIMYIKQESTARATCQALKTIHEHANLSSKLHLLRKLYGTKLEEASI